MPTIVEPANHHEGLYQVSHRSGERTDSKKVNAVSNCSCLPPTTALAPHAMEPAHNVDRHHRITMMHQRATPLRRPTAGTSARSATSSDVTLRADHDVQPSRFDASLLPPRSTTLLNHQAYGVAVLDRRESLQKVSHGSRNRTDFEIVNQDSTCVCTVSILGLRTHPMEPASSVNEQNVVQDRHKSPLFLRRSVATASNTQREASRA